MHACGLGRVRGRDALSRVPPSNGVVIAKREVAPSSAFVSAAVSSSDAWTSVTSAFESSLAFAEAVLRVTARTS
jgi:hypothetical protein